MADQPNLLLIMSDQHNPHVLGCAGDRVVRTPHLDRLAARGVRFPNAYCPSPLCVPARMSFLAARHPSAIQVWTNACVLASDVPTFAHALGAAGYETVLCGRMHFVGPDQHHGFARRLVGDVIGAHFGGPGPNFGHVPVATAGQTRVAVEIAGPGRISYQAYDADVTAAAVEYLRRRGAAGDGRPFCLLVGYVLPHCPYICPQRLYDAYEPRVDVPQLPPGYLDRLHPAMRIWRQRRGVDALTEEQARRARAAYYGLVTLVDECVGQVLAALEGTGLAGDTVVVYTTDHGDMAGEHRMWWKMSFYEGSVGVPLIWSWPGHFVQGRAAPAVTSLLDVGPTLLALAGAPALPHTSGRSLAPWLAGQDVPDWPDEAYAETAPSLGVPPARMLRRGPWKLVHYHGYDAPQLFNLAEDPGELEDRGTDPACAAVRAELLAGAQAGWSAAALEALLARRAADRRLLAAWYQAQQPPDPIHWSIAPEYNVFPGEADGAGASAPAQAAGDGGTPRESRRGT